MVAGRPLPQSPGSSAPGPVEWGQMKPPGSHLSEDGFPGAPEVTVRTVK